MRLRGRRLDPMYFYEELLRRLDQSPDASTRDVLDLAIGIDLDVIDYIVDGGWTFETFCDAHTPTEALDYIADLWEPCFEPPTVDGRVL